MLLCGKCSIAERFLRSDRRRVRACRGHRDWKWKNRDSRLVLQLVDSSRLGKGEESRGRNHAGILLAVDHKARSRVDLEGRLIDLLLVQDPVPQLLIGQRVIERVPAVTTSDRM